MTGIEWLPTLLVQHLAFWSAYWSPDFDLLYGFRKAGPEISLKELPSFVPPPEFQPKLRLRGPDLAAIHFLPPPLIP